MPVSLIPSFLSFCFINGITPGPANLCSLSTAMKEGKQAALRQWRGLFTGFAIVSLGSAMVNAFLGSVLGEYVRYLAWAGAAYKQLSTHSHEMNTSFWIYNDVFRTRL